jgi:hypothetical protein
MTDELCTLRTKHLELKEHLTNHTQIPLRVEDEPNLREPTPSAYGEQNKKEVNLPDPPIFQNDGNSTWEDWYVDMKVKLKSVSTWDDEEKWGYVLSRTGKNPRALIQTGYLTGKYTTAQDMMQTLVKAYNDPHKEAKALDSYRNLRMGEQEHFDTFMSKFTTYAAPSRYHR